MELPHATRQPRPVRSPRIPETRRVAETSRRRRRLPYLAAVRGGGGRRGGLVRGGAADAGAACSAAGERWLAGKRQRGVKRGAEGSARDGDGDGGGRPERRRHLGDGRTACLPAPAECRPERLVRVSLTDSGTISSSNRCLVLWRESQQQGQSLGLTQPAASILVLLCTCISARMKSDNGS